MPLLDDVLGWWQQGGVAGSLGMKPVDVQLAEAGEKTPDRVATPLAKQVLPLDTSNPMWGWLSPAIIEGWHGTPHLFPSMEGAPLGKFTDAAIGSGEGAQAYGWGHYIAGNQRVGESYMLPGRHTGYTIDDKPLDFLKEAISNEPGRSKAIDEILTMGNVKDAQAKLLNNYRHYSERYPEQDWTQLKEAFDWLANNEHRIKPFGGYLLQVNIKPDEHEFLDWARPASEWKEDVLNRAVDLAGKLNLKVGNVTGGRLYVELTRHFGSQEKASKALHAAGIPGIRYLDAGSRTSGKGTNNYVIFDPSNLEIVGRR